MWSTNILCYIHYIFNAVGFFFQRKSSPEIKEFMEEQGYTDYNQVEQHYVKKTLENVKDTGYKYMIWQDPIDNEVEVSPNLMSNIIS